MNKSARPPAQRVRKPIVDGSDGHAVHNSILRDLPPKERRALFAKIQLVEVPVQTVLNEMAEPIQFCYFINSGLASILNIMSDGKSVEVGLSGKEGFVGLPILVGFSTSPTQAVMQIGGTAFRVSAQDLEDVIRDCPLLERKLQRYSQEMNLQVTQVAAYNRLHEVEERLARWLLMSQDRVESSSFPLTQQFLAHMLGTRRASVTIAAGILQKAGLITYKRGDVKIVDRDGLKGAACECYSHLNRQIKSWRNHPR